MKIFEIISESQSKSRLPKNSRYGIPGARIWPDLDNSSPYHAFRMGVAMAGSPEKDMPRDGPTQQKMVTLGYTPEDEEIALSAGRKLGFKSKQLTPSGSTEMPSINHTSPVNANSGKSKRK
jgi:hypothetical protein